MSKEKKLVPELRFPEFVGEWEEKKLDDLTTKISDGIHTTPRYDDCGEYYFINGNNLVDGKIWIDDKTKRVSKEEYNRHKRDLTQSTMLLSINGTIGNLAVYNNEKVILGKSACYLNVDENKINKTYLIYFIQSDIVKSYFESELTGSTIKNLSLQSIKETIVKVPTKHKEQQEIASCLYSLDKLIIAHRNKLETLKDHKKGLMQNLFPQEGRTLPNYRFPEFEDDNEWTEKELGSCLSKNPEYGVNEPAVPYSSNLPTYLRITDISELGNFLANEKVSVDREVSENNYLSEGDIVLARTGASVGKSYKYREKDGKLVFAGFLIRINPDKKKLDSELLFQYLSSPKFWKWVSFTSVRSGQPGINATEYSSMPIYLPPTLNEQKKIASCLSSLDELIAAQMDKIEQLQLHKKGLMQRLFPKN